MSVSEIPLKEVIQELRVQLAEAIEAGDGEDLRFGIEDLELELQVVVTKGGAGNLEVEGGLKFMVLNALGKGEVSGSYEKSHLQKLRLKLRPRSESGRSTDLSG